MRITTVQTSIYWEEPDKNYEHLEKLLEKVKVTDLVILPEMFNTGFSMQATRIAEDMNGQGLEWLKKMAARFDAAFLASMVIKESNGFVNRACWVFPSGVVKTYDKRHLFRMADEHLSYRAGENRLIVEYKGWKFCPLICYDLRFPVWSRNVVKSSEFSYDCLIYIANWPAARRGAWDKLLYARAIENQAYVAGVNRIGSDGNGVEYNGGSVIIDYRGDRLDNHKNGKESCVTLTLNKTELDDFRMKFPSYLDADGFTIKV